MGIWGGQSVLTDEELLISFKKCSEISDDGFLFVSRDGRIAYINPAYSKYIGVSQEEALNKPVLELIETSKMSKIAQDSDFIPETGVLHRTSNKQFCDREQFVIVNRANASKNGRSIAAVAQIKFVRKTIELYSAFNDVYAQLEYYKKELGHLVLEQYSFDSIIGNSGEITTVKEITKRAATNDFSVLITGETGTGKEVFANALHYASNRRSKPFIRINCASIPTELFESELFGYEEGSFTGARKGGKKGKFELADGGTIFLDEIGEMPLFMQAKLLRVIQEREIERVGGTSPVSIDVRIIAATNKNLPNEIEEKRFRQDLYYRLNVIEIKIPPLRSRKEDIGLFIDFFLGEINQKYHSDVMIDPEARLILMSYRWPGNVRELKNTVQRCYVLNENGVITLHTIPEKILADLQYTKLGNVPRNSLELIMDEVERKIISEEILRAKGNLRQTAFNLGIHRTTLYKKMDKLGISRQDIIHMPEKNETK